MVVLEALALLGHLSLQGKDQKFDQLFLSIFFKHKPIIHMIYDLINVVSSSVHFRYTFGSALFVGWVGGGILVVSGVMLCLACRGMMPEKR